MRRTTPPACSPRLRSSCASDASDASDAASLRQPECNSISRLGRDPGAEALAWRSRCSRLRCEALCSCSGVSASALSSDPLPLCAPRPSASALACRFHEMSGSCRKASSIASTESLWRRSAPITPSAVQRKSPSTPDTPMALTSMRVSRKGTFSGHLARWMATSKQSPKSMCSTLPENCSSIKLDMCRSPSPSTYPTMDMVASERVYVVRRSSQCSAELERSQSTCARSFPAQRQCVVAAAGRELRHQPLLHLERDAARRAVVLHECVQRVAAIDPRDQPRARGERHDGIAVDGEVGTARLVCRVGKQCVDEAEELHHTLVLPEVLVALEQEVRDLAGPLLGGDDGQLALERADAHHGPPRLVRARHGEVEVSRAEQLGRDRGEIELAEMSHVLAYPFEDLVVQLPSGGDVGGLSPADHRPERMRPRSSSAARVAARGAAAAAAPTSHAPPHDAPGPGPGCQASRYWQYWRGPPPQSKRATPPRAQPATSPPTAPTCAQARRSPSRPAAPDCPPRASSAAALAWRPPAAARSETWRRRRAGR
eukprot:scaffold36200_cov63-Phaeocystis_antarctica.AAC.5